MALIVLKKTCMTAATAGRFLRLHGTASLGDFYPLVY